MLRRLRAVVVIASIGGLAAVTMPAQAARTQAGGGLKLQVIAPDPGSIGDRLSLDVSYRGGSVEAVEVYLDGGLVAKRQLGVAQTHGVITFTLETMLLTEGNHDLLIKAFGPDGKSVEVPARIRIPGPDLTAPVRIAYPQNGIEVSGTVPIRVKVDPDLQRQKPYVTFFINRELKVLRNFPPYEYNWDTTKYANGWHVLEAWTQSADMASPYKSRPVNVSVNNSGGLTRQQATVEDLRAQNARPAGPPVPEAQKTIVLAPDPASPQSLGTPARSKLGAEPSGTTRLAEPSSIGRASATLPRANAPRVAAAPDRLPRVAPTLVGTAAAEPVLRRAVAAAPGRASSRPQPTVGVAKGDTLASVSRRTGADVTEIARLNNIPPSPKSALPAGRSLIVPQVGAFDVAFDGTPIRFDVTPRFQAGIGLAPIRQIFEHTGGRLYWFGGRAQTVRAVNDTREIELRIGSDQATVNNRTLKLERKPFIESGRTLVPLSFMRDALDLNVQYDPNSGRMSIRSK